MTPIHGIEILNPFQLGSLRIFIAGLVLMPVALRHLKILRNKHSITLLFVGLTGNLIPAFLFPLAETEIQSSLAGLLNMGTSVFIIIISWVFFKDKINRIQFFGFCLGALGLSLILAKQIDSSENNFFYALYVILATVFYATSLSLIKYKLQHLKAVVITSLAFFLMFIPATISCFYTGAFQAIEFSEPGLRSIGYLLVLSVLGTAVAVLLFNHLVAISTPLFTSSVTYIMPIIALFLGVLDGEFFDPINLIWILLIFSGVYFMSKKKQKTVKNPSV